MDQGQLDALYQQYLGRRVDPSGAATWANADYNTVVQGILGSQEYANRQGASSPAPSQPTSTAQEPPPDWLLPSDYVGNGYAAPYTPAQVTQPVDPSWIRQMNGQTYASIKGPSDLSGGEYLVNPSTGKFVTDASGNPVGVTYPQSNGFSDWVTTPLGSLALTFGIPLATMGGVAALEGLGAIGAGAGAAEGAGALTTADILGSTGFTPAAGSGASFGIVPGAAYTSGALTTADILGSTGFTPTAGNSFEIVPGATYGLSEAAAAAGLANAGYSASQIANLAKTGLSLASVASKLLGGSGSTTTGSATNPMANALRNIVPTTAMTGAQSGANFNMMRGNVNPFSYAKDVPTQTIAQSKADPFAALNVPQTPVQPFNPLANLFG